MEAPDELKAVAAEKQRESTVAAEAYAATLLALVPANLVLVAGAALLSLAAGATMLVENDILTKPESSLLAFASAALTIVHSKLRCEEYQGQCKKLESFYRALAEAYGNLRYVADPSEFRQQFVALNKRVSAEIEITSAQPFGWARRKAEQPTVGGR